MKNAGVKALLVYLTPADWQVQQCRGRGAIKGYQLLQFIGRKPMNFTAFVAVEGTLMKGEPVSGFLECYTFGLACRTQIVAEYHKPSFPDNAMRDTIREDGAYCKQKLPIAANRTICRQTAEIKV